MTQSNQDQAVREWMISLGFVHGEYGDYWLLTDSWPQLSVDGEQAHFFYTTCQKAEREAKAEAYGDACYWLEDRLASKKNVAKICSTRAKVLRGEMDAPNSRFAPPQNTKETES